MSCFFLLLSRLLLLSALGRVCFVIDVSCLIEGRESLTFRVLSRHNSVPELPRAKRFHGCNSSKADVGRTDLESKQHWRDLVDRRYVYNQRWQPDRPGQNYDSHPSLRKPSLQSSRASLPSMEPRTGGK